MQLNDPVLQSGKITLANCPSRDEISIAAGRFRVIELTVNGSPLRFISVSPRSLSYLVNNNILITGPAPGLKEGFEFVAELNPEAKGDVGWIQVVEVTPVE